VSSGGNVDRAVRFSQHANFDGHFFILGQGVFDSAWATNQPGTNYPGFNFNDQVSSSSYYLPPL